MIKYLILIVLLFQISLISQEDKPSYWIGANAGLNLNLNSSDFTSFTGYECCSKGFEGGLGVSYYLGFLFKYEIQDNLKFDLRLNYRPFGGEFTERQKIGNTDVIDPNGTILTVDAITDITVSPILDLFGLDLGVEYSVMKNISILGGLSPNYILQGSFSQSEKLVSPDNVVFAENESKLRNTYDNTEINELNKIQFQVYLGGAYSIEMGKDKFLNIELKYYQSLTNIEKVDWKVNNLFAGVSYQYPIYPKIKKTIQRDTIYIRDTTDLIVYDQKEVGLKLIDTEKKKDEIEDEKNIYVKYKIIEKYENKKFAQSSISAKMRIYGIDTDGTIQENPTITIEETETEQGFPVLPYIFFDYNSDDLSKTSQKLLDKSETKDFDENNLNWDVFDIYNNNLNVIAKRVKENNLTLKLVGNKIIGKDFVQDKNVIENRLNSIKNYLTTNWDINSSKIKSEIVDIDLKDVNKNDDIFKEASRVELVSDNVKVNQPVYLKEVIKSSNPPKVGVDVEITASNPPVDWKLSINQNKSILRDYNGNELQFSKVWNLEEEPMPLLEKNIDFNFTANDKLNSNTKLNENLIIKQLTIKKKREVLKDDKKLEKYSLIVFDYNSAELKATHLDVINKVKESIKPNSIVTIAGYADRTGDTEYNKNLASRRINAIRKLINVPAKEFIEIPYGNSVLLYDNDTEVGRSLSRTVQITIETPVK